MTDRTLAETDTRDLYAAWAPHYPPCAHNPLMQVEEAAVLELLPAVTGLTILDAGCGTGRYMSLLAARGARRVVGVDLSVAMLSRVRGPRVRADLCRLPFGDRSFNLVVSGLALPDVAEIDPIFVEWARILVSGGVVVCSTLHPRGATSGWKRTFETRAGTRCLPAYWHSLHQHRLACERAGLVLDACSEPSLDLATVKGMTRHGEPRAAGGGSTPVALVVRARKLH